MNLTHEQAIDIAVTCARLATENLQIRDLLTQAQTLVKELGVENTLLKATASARNTDTGDIE